MAKRPVDLHDGRRRAAPSFVDDEFGARLRALRVRAWLNQDQLAEKIGIHTSIVSRHETGRAKPSAATLHAYAELFGVSHAYLQSGDGDKVSSEDQHDAKIMRALRESDVPFAVREYVTKNPLQREFLPEVWLRLLQRDRGFWEYLGGDDLSMEAIDRIAGVIDETARLRVSSPDAVDRRSTSGDAGGAAETPTARGGNRVRVVPHPVRRS
jgi:transcriptional regulator with XRE-family HTH domain